MARIFKDEHKLENPAWYSLKEAHAGFAMGNEEIKRYHPSIVAFAAYQSSQKDILYKLDLWIEPEESFFIIGELGALPPNYTIVSILPCVQMICTSALKMTESQPIDKLGDADKEDMAALVNLVQPGYYKPGTRLMGDYFGIRQEGKLVAMTGERMRMHELTEISAVVTHPAFTGRGFAQQLITHAVNKNLAAGVTPFLHVAETNERAIKIYEYLGFTRRRIISFTKIKREGL